MTAPTTGLPLCVEPNGCDEGFRELGELTKVGPRQKAIAILPAVGGSGTLPEDEEPFVYMPPRFWRKDDEDMFRLQEMGPLKAFSELMAAEPLWPMGGEDLLDEGSVRLNDLLAQYERASGRSYFLVIATWEGNGLLVRVWRDSAPMPAMTAMGIIREITQQYIILAGG